MKKLFSILTVAAAMIFTTGMHGMAQQIRTPRPSPTATLTQNVGLTDITITYSRPGVKGRKIFGGLLPFGQLWRTGANMATKIGFSDDVTLEGHSLKAGTYALFTIPDKDEWTIIINSNYEQNGTSEYKESDDVLRFKVKPQHLNDMVETFRIDINNIRNSTATIDLAWENTQVSINMDVGTDTKVMAAIKRAMDPSTEAGKYYTAANYYYSNDKDLNQALDWINKSLLLDPDSFFALYLKSNILAKMGDYKNAISAAQQSRDLAQKANNDEFVSMNDKNINAWKAMK